MNDAAFLFLLQGIAGLVTQQLNGASHGGVLTCSHLTESYRQTYVNFPPFITLQTQIVFTQPQKYH